MRDPVVTVAAALLIGAGIIAAYPIVLLFIALAAFVWFASRSARACRAEMVEQAAANQVIAARADREHAQFMAGNPAGMWGQYPPAALG